MRDLQTYNITKLRDMFTDSKVERFITTISYNIYLYVYIQPSKKFSKIWINLLGICVLTKRCCKRIKNIQTYIITE